MTNTDTLATRIWDYTLELRLAVLDQVDDEHGFCTHCAETDAVVQANVYFSAAGEDVILQCCLACVIPAIDATPYLDHDKPLTLEVARDATHRPF